MCRQLLHQMLGHLLMLPSLSHPHSLQPYVACTSTEIPTHGQQLATLAGSANAMTLTTTQCTAPTA